VDVGSTFRLAMQVKVLAGGAWPVGSLGAPEKDAITLCADKPLANLNLLVADDAPELRILL
jgi:hypothetical protein